MLYGEGIYGEGLYGGSPPPPILIDPTYVYLVEQDNDILVTGDDVVVYET